MQKAILLSELSNCRQFFDRSTSPLGDEHEDFAPQVGMLTVAQQVAHVAHTIDWFLHGTFSGEGFQMDFEQVLVEMKQPTTLKAARAWLARAFDEAAAKIENTPLEQLVEDYPAGGFMEGPKYRFVFGIVEHTAHHRGALTVYQRALNLTPPMPYM